MEGKGLAWDAVITQTGNSGSGNLVRVPDLIKIAYRYAIQMHYSKCRDKIICEAPEESTVRR